MTKQIVLISPDGREYAASGVAEATRLKARGYKPKPAPKAEKKTQPTPPKK